MRRNPALFAWLLCGTLDIVKGADALLPHIVFVGWPLAWLTRKAHLC